MLINYLADYHVHSNISPDSNCSMAEHCEHALLVGIDEIAFTDHYEFYTEIPAAISFNERYLSKFFHNFQTCLDQYGKRLKLRAGIEFGQMHLDLNRARKIIRQYPFDYIIGSVHKINNVDLSKHKYNKDTIEGITRSYYQSLYEMAKTGDYDCLGHLNLVKRYSVRSGMIENDQKYEKQIKEILKVVIDRGKGVEINTSGLRQTLKAPLPSKIVLEWYYEMGGEILTIGSDAHRSKDLAMNFTEVYEMIQEIGFKKLSSYDKRCACPII